MSYLQATPFVPGRSIQREVEDFVLSKVTLDQAINAKIGVLYKRMIMKLYALDGWDADLIAECVGVPKDTVTETIHHLRPRVMEAIREAQQA